MRKLLPLVVAVAAGALLIGVYAAAGGTSFTPSPVADPCTPRELPAADGVSGQLERVVLRAADGVACEFGVSREDLILSLRSVDRLERLAAENGIDQDELESSLRRGLIQAADQAEQEGAISSSTASTLRAAVGVLPLNLLLSIVRRGAGLLG